MGQSPSAASQMHDIEGNGRNPYRDGVSNSEVRKDSEHDGDKVLIPGGPALENESQGE